MTMKNQNNFNNKYVDQNELFQAIDTIYDALVDSLASNDLTAAYSRESLIGEVLPHFDESEYESITKIFDFLVLMGGLPYYCVGERFDGEPLFEVQPEILEEIVEDLMEEVA